MRWAAYTRLMKKTLLALTALTLSASSALADNYVGGSIGSGLTVHYQSDLSAGSAIRYGLNLSALGFNFSQLSVGGGVDYLNSFSAGSANLGGLNPYYGFGLDAGVALGGVTGVSVYPHVLGGLSYSVTAPLSVFVELNAGPNISIGTNTNVSFGYGARLGLNYRLP